MNYSTSTMFDVNREKATLKCDLQRDQNFPWSWYATMNWSSRSGDVHAEGFLCFGQAEISTPAHGGSLARLGLSMKLHTIGLTM